MSDGSLKIPEITVRDIQRNMAPAKLYQEAIRREPDSAIAASGALIAYSGAKTGRSPADKRIVKEEGSAEDVWWGDVNIPLDEHTFRINRERPDGWWVGDLGQIYRPKYFIGGVAIHGSLSVPAYPASHGCVRVSVAAMDMIWEQEILPRGTTVVVYGEIS